MKKRSLKRLLALLLTSVLALSMTACSNGGDDTVGTTTAAGTEKTTAAGTDAAADTSTAASGELTTITLYPAAGNISSGNRKKKYILEEGIPVPFLIDLGVMTQNGNIINAHYDKFRQINRFLEYIEDILPSLPTGRELRILDFGCGKSYLTFAIYYYLKVLKGYPVRITGLDLKEDVIRHCNELAVKYGYDKLEFLCGDIAYYDGCSQVDMVVTLHAQMGQEVLHCPCRW